MDLIHDQNLQDKPLRDKSNIIMPLPRPREFRFQRRSNVIEVSCYRQQVASTIRLWSDQFNFVDYPKLTTLDIEW